MIRSNKQGSASAALMTHDRKVQTMMRSKLFWLLCPLVSAALALLLANGCASTNANEKKADGKPGAPGAAAPAGRSRTFPVRVQTVVTSPVTYEVQAIGSVEAQDVYHIDARVPGTIYDVGFNEGDEVGPDKVLCTIAPDAYRFANLKARALYDQAVADLADFKRKSENGIRRAEIDLARSQVEIARRKDVKELGAISDEEIQLYEALRDRAAVDLKDQKEAAQTQIKTLEAAVAEKEAAWKIAEDDLRKSTVRPPIKGTIEKRLVTNMVYVTAGTELATIVDRSQLKLKFKVAERDASAVKEGGVVTFAVPAFPSRRFEATIYHIENLLDREARTLTCWARVTKEAELLRPGYYATVNIVTQVKQHAMVVASSAVLPTEKGFTGFVIIDGKAESRTLTTGLSVTNNSIEILDGLHAGEQLVIEGASALMDGVAVKILDGLPGTAGTLRDAEHKGSEQKASGDGGQGTEKK